MPNKTRNHVVFFLNGERQEVGADQAGMMFSDYLRYKRGLTGTKVVCAEGDCGACSVLRIFPLSQDYNSKSPRYRAINSCIATVAQLDGSSLVTVDALAEGSELTPVQKRMMEANGSQCGFCTPGFVVALSGLIEKKLCSAKKDVKSCGTQEVKNALTGNLCRCTGYQPIIDAGTSIPLSECKPLAKRFYSVTQANALKKALATPVQMDGDFTFYAPKSVKAAAALLKKSPDARLAAATTDLGVVHNKGKIKLTKLISLHAIPELYRIQALKAKGRVSVGARVTLSELRTFLKVKHPEFSNFLDLFASPQIKNVATLVGNVGNASPIADTPPFLLVANATVKIAGSTGVRSVPLDSFYQGYRKTALKRGELITAIEFDLPGKHESMKLYKASQRKDLDISGVNAAFRVNWDGPSRKLARDVRIAMGGVAATPLRLKKTEKFMQGKALTPEVFVKAASILRSEMNPIGDLRGTASFRRVVVENLLSRFFRELAVKQPVKQGASK